MLDLEFHRWSNFDNKMEWFNVSKAFFKSKMRRWGQYNIFVDIIKSAGNNIEYGVSSRCFFLETVLGGSEYVVFV